MFTGRFKKIEVCYDVIEGDGEEHNSRLAGCEMDVRRPGKQPSLTADSN